MLRKLIIFICLSILFGCSPADNLAGVKHNPDVLIYSGSNAQETYNKAIDFFNQNVSYYKEYIEKGTTKRINTFYKSDDGINMSELDIYNDQGINSLSYACYKGENLYILYLNEYDIYEYEELKDNYLDRDHMYLDITKQEGYRVLSIDRIDLNNQVKLILKIEDSHTYKMGGDFTYMIKEIIIDNQGYIIKENIGYYADLNCHNEIEEPVTIYYKKINQHENQTIDNEIKKIQSCQGHDYERVSELLEF